MREFLVTWTGFPLDEAEWIPESNFRDRTQMERQIAQDQPVEGHRGQAQDRAGNGDMTTSSQL